MKAGYLARIRARLQPLSVEQHSLDAMVREWPFTGDSIDHADDPQVCELCDQEDLRWTFLVANLFTKHQLWIGSKCILRFKFAIYDAMQDVYVTEPSRVLRALREAQQRTEHQYGLALLRQLYLKEHAPAFRSMVERAGKYFAAHHTLTPKLAAVVFAGFERYRIPYRVSVFRISLRRDSHKAAFECLSASARQLVLTALSPEQRTRML